MKYQMKNKWYEVALMKKYFSMLLIINNYQGFNWIF